MNLNSYNEKNFYNNLSNSLKSGNFEEFRNLVNKSVKYDIFLDPKKISNRFEIISNLLIGCIRNVSELYQTSSLGDFINILRFSNEFNLVERDSNYNDLNYIENLKKDKILQSNLNDLFGNISNSFILFLKKDIPKYLYEYLIQYPLNYFQDTATFVYYVKNLFFNQYSIYGLNVNFICTFKQFLRDFENNYRITQENKEKINTVKSLSHSGDFFEFEVSYIHPIFYYNYEDQQERYIVKKHLVSPKNILKNLSNIKRKDNYNFYNLSMVLLGGLGPQGHGFTYSTPRDEVIEICSDIRENKAIIIKYKRFLKEQFLIRLEKELTKLNSNVKKKIIKHLSLILDQKELIGYNKKDLILKQIKDYLSSIKEINISFKNDFYSLINKISNAISIILRPINMRDQFKCRMELATKGEIKSEDIAKLTILKNKSHYDILRERVFFQYLVEWFYEIYLKNNSA